jgi:hypothetical protein
MRAPGGVPPGSEVRTAGTSRRPSQSNSRPAWVDLPVPSPPSKATKSPRPGERGGASIEGLPGGSAGCGGPDHGTGRVRRRRAVGGRPPGGRRA